MAFKIIFIKDFVARKLSRPLPSRNIKSFSNISFSQFLNDYEGFLQPENFAGFDSRRPSRVFQSQAFHGY